MTRAKRWRASPSRCPANRFNGWAAISSGATLPDGFYSFEIETRQDGKLIATEPVDTYARITEARLVDGDPVIVFASGETLEANDVTAVRLPQL